MGQRINRIALRSFRGATAPTVIELDGSKPMVVLFGENGTGKSTIVDALDFVCNESIGSLGERSTGSSSKLLFMPSIGRPAAELQATITSGEDTWVGTLKGRDTVVTGPHNRPRVHILRRNKLTQLVDAKPSERYEVLRKFVGVTNVEAAEDSLDRAVKDAKKRMDDYAGRKAEADRALRQLWEAEGRHGSDPLSWAAGMAATDLSSLEATVAEIEEMLRHIANAVQLVEQRSNSEAALAEKKRQLALIADERGAAARDGVPEDELVTVLTMVNRLLEPPCEPHACPVCQQPVVGAELRQQLAERIAAMQGQLDRTHRLAAAQKMVEQAEAVLSGQVAAIITEAGAIVRKLRASRRGSIQRASIDWARFDALLQPVVSPTSALTPLAEEAIGIALTIRGPLDQERTAAQRHIGMMHAIRGYYTTVTTAETRARGEERVYKALAAALALARKTRLHYTGDILTTVEDECNRLYRHLHPGESIGPLTLRMNEKQRGSILQSIGFEGHESVPPQAYFSEAHLDTLGFCLFLAIAKYHSGSQAIIVLDDVFTSVDAGHLGRMVELLAVESRYFAQMIVATHYRQWKNRFSNARGFAANAQLINLRPWSRGTGVRADKALVAVDELRQALQSADIDRQAVSSRASLLLAEILDSLTVQYACRVPRRAENEYTLAELLQATTALSQALKITRMPASGAGGTAGTVAEAVALAPLFEKIGNTNFVKNATGAVADADIVEFGTQVVRLATAMTCPACGTIPAIRDGAQFSCVCRGTSMTP